MKLCPVMNFPNIRFCMRKNFINYLGIVKRTLKISASNFSESKASNACSDGNAGNDGKDTVRDKLFQKFADVEEGKKKITVVGTGNTGVATATALLTLKVTNDLLLFDKNKDKCWAEAEDLIHGAQFLYNAKIKATDDFSEASQSSIIIITASEPPEANETLSSMMSKNAKIIEDLVPKLVEGNKNAMLVIVTSPCDILTYIAWKKSCLDPNRVMGMGTHLNSSRFQYYISKRLGIGPSAVSGMVIGEHGDTIVPIWSAVSVGGVRLREIQPTIGLPGDPEKFDEVNEDVLKAAVRVISLKKYASTASAVATANLCRAILLNTHEIIPVSVNAKGMYGIETDTYLSLPCTVGVNGVTSIVKQTFDELEKEQLKKSADILHKALQDYEQGGQKV